MTYTPPHIQEALEDPVDTLYREKEEVVTLLEKSPIEMPDLFEHLYGITTCTSCRKWWPALFIGASIGFSAAFGPISWAISTLMWFFFWIAVYLYINHESNTHTKDQPFKNKSFMATVDSVLGSKDQNFIYYTCLMYCMAAIPPFTPAAILIKFVTIWLFTWLFLRLILLNRHHCIVDEIIQHRMPLGVMQRTLQKKRKIRVD